MSRHGWRDRVQKKRTDDVIFSVITPFIRVAEDTGGGGARFRGARRSSYRVVADPKETFSNRLRRGGGTGGTMGVTSRLCFLEGTNTHMQLPNRVTPITTPPPPPPFVQHRFVFTKIFTYLTPLKQSEDLCAAPRERASGGAPRPWMTFVSFSVTKSARNY